MDSITEDDLLHRLADGVSQYAIVIVNAKGEVTYWNRGAELITGYERGEMLGRPVDRLFPEEDRAERLPARELDEAAGGRNVPTERWLVRRNGSPFWALGMLTALRGDDGALLGYGRILRDRTDLKELHDSLLQTAKSLGTSSEKRNLFVATLVHELRNFLAAAYTGVDVLRARAEPGLHGLIDTLGRPIRQMGRLVDNLLESSRIEFGTLQLHRTRVSLRSVVDQAVELCQGLMDARRHDFRVSVQTGVELDVDPDRVVQIIVNLLTNAAKFTEPNGRITLIALRDGPDAVVTVRDSGMGIHPDNLKAIFELFEQFGPDMRMASGGLGIGLPLVRDLVQLHGGSIQAASPGPGKGSEFIVRLPLYSH